MQLGGFPQTQGPFWGVPIRRMMLWVNVWVPPCMEVTTSLVFPAAILHVGLSADEFLRLQQYCVVLARVYHCGSSVESYEFQVEVLG